MLRVVVGDITHLVWGREHRVAAVVGALHGELTGGLQGKLKFKVIWDKTVLVCASMALGRRIRRRFGRCKP
eukprot:2342884-Lingulodinium_polyedra.AAC.1